MLICFGHNLDNDAVLCTATESCMYGNVRAKKIICSGLNSCENARIEGDKVRVYGMTSASHADIYASQILGYGHYSLQFADIDTMVTEKLKVSLFGHNTGYGASIICRSGRDCKLVCKSSGCFGTTFFCIAGSICSVVPQDCRPNDYSVTKVRDVNCPIWKTALSYEETMDMKNDLEFIAMENEQIISAENYANKHLVLLILMVGSACFCALYCKFRKNGYETMR